MSALGRIGEEKWVHGRELARWALRTKFPYRYRVRPVAELAVNDDVGVAPDWGGEVGAGPRADSVGPENRISVPVPR